MSTGCMSTVFVLENEGLIGSEMFEKSFQLCLVRRLRRPLLIKKRSVEPVKDIGL